ncbi:MAG TPA: hypothetical protein VGN46_09105 [Luteibacter sp.]|jgi:hypothetical protein|uniref:hypothetical protein n=1 Tax=Luteibacter sp. TaxID=1886636 RepID=UPI002F3F95E8
MSTPSAVSDLSRGSGKTYLQVTCGDVTACLSVELTGQVVYAEGLLWRDGLVLGEFSGAVHVRGASVEQAIREAVAARMRRA